MDFELLTDGTITDVPDFWAGSAHCGLKTRSKRDDICIIYTPLDTVASAVFTTNLFAAAPVIVCREQLQQGRNIKAVVVNAGIANACTGQQGYLNCLKTIKMAAVQLNLKPEEVLATSTGVIGKQLPMDMISRGIKECSQKLSLKGGHDAAAAILTTDKIKKEIAVKVNIGPGQDVVIGGIAKGSGMIEPNMATMLAFLATNAHIEKKALDKLLMQGVEDSFNSITVDGCQSTNDMVLVQANSQSGVHIKEGNAGWKAFSKAFFYVLQFLSKKIVEDGEGATKLVQVTVEGAAQKQAAKAIAKKVANSNLFKTAVYGQDLNWGRICAAMGASGQDFDPDKVDLYLNEICIVKNGLEQEYDAGAAQDLIKGRQMEFRISLNQGKQKSVVWTSDLSHDYVSINATYTT
ncbi:MAG: bifunctional glutamate N-acetyltransferase/amino-acid acetyltransferase ArgJ [Actinomycetota bacterium]|nr:bifunctional glutamate N-acetyltransferase/amino-acid acetyltransferase ArgJ [Actinomycetota bacterium]